MALLDLGRTRNRAMVALACDAPHLSTTPSTQDEAVFRIRVFAPSAALALGTPQTTGELLVGDTRLRFVLDLRYWRVSDYERQWQRGLSRLVRGASTSALMSAYRGTHDAPHHMWALWRDDGHVYIQPHCVVGGDLASPFDPHSPYEHVGVRVAATQLRLPIAEWCVELEELVASALNIRWPFGQ